MVKYQIPQDNTNVCTTLIRIHPTPVSPKFGVLLNFSAIILDLIE